MFGEVITVEDLVELLQAKGGQSRRDLLQQGVRNTLIEHALSEGVVRQPSGDDLLVATETLSMGDEDQGEPGQDEPAGEPDVLRNQSAEAGPVNRSEQESRGRASAAPQKESRPAIEELLKGRTLVITYTYLDQIPGKVNVGVRLGDDVTRTTFDSIDSSKVRHSSERVLEMIAEQIKDADKRGGKPKAAPAKTAAKRSTSRKSPPAKKAAGSSGTRKVSANKPGSMKGAAKKGAAKKKGAR
jgi:hypothetical protein